MCVDPAKVLSTMPARFHCRWVLKVPDCIGGPLNNGVGDFGQTYRCLIGLLPRQGSLRTARSSLYRTEPTGDYGEGARIGVMTHVAVRARCYGPSQFVRATA